MMPLLGYAMALLSGLSLGLLGSGGTILTMPVLVYLFRMSPVAATAYSLFIVGLTSMVGLGARLRAGQVDFRAAAWFALPSLSGVFLARRYVIHALPETLSMPWGAEVARDSLIMSFFGMIMMTAAVSMILHSRIGASAKVQESARAGGSVNLPMLGFEGFLVGNMTGMVGAGGGFLIVPVLILLANLPMETAIGTSLAIITAQSTLGFLTDLSLMENIRWSFLLGFSLLSVAGVLAGSLLGRRIRAERLKMVFGCSVLLIACAILGHEFFARGLP